MRNGNFIKEKTEYLKEKFKTQEGLWDFFIGTAIWSFIIIEYNKVIFAKILEFVSFLPEGNVLKYIAYLIFGVFGSLLGIAISVILNKIFKLLFNGGLK